MDGDLYCMCEHQKPRRSAQPRYRALAARFQNITIHLEVDSGFIACESNANLRSLVRLFALLIKQNVVDMQLLVLNF